MQRIALKPRENWQVRVEEAGMLYHTIDDEIYWDESACYRFTRREIDTLYLATAELQRLCLEAVEEVFRRNLFDRLSIPEWSVPYIKYAWEMDEPSLYGRFDLAWDGSGPPKLLEYNADTPTALLEAAVVQWFWLQDRFPTADQFNSIHEKLIAFWEQWPYLRQDPVHFACSSGSREDLGNLEYLRDTAIQGGMATQRLFVEEIGWDREQQRFVDLDCAPIRTLFKLYPWEWLLREEFGRHLPAAGIRMIEPAWKAVLSTKGLLPILWELFPGHPNLLPAVFDDHPLSGDLVRKPLYSREGSNVEILRGGSTVEETGGSYGSEGYIRQQYAPLPNFAGNYPVIGSWVIGGEPAGIGIREDTSEITTNSSRFIPHYFVED